MAGVLLAAAAALGLGLANLAEPSLWHDEAVHVFVAKSIADTGVSQHPSGVPYTNGMIYNWILAGFIKLGGWGEGVVRLPAVFAGAMNVVLVYLVARPLVGARAALIAAWMLALCPWTVSWSREARFYSMQQTFYLLTIGAFWLASTRTSWRPAICFGVCALLAYAAGLMTSFHSGLYLAPIGIFAVAMTVRNGFQRDRWMLIAVVCALIAVATFGFFALQMNPMDRDTVLNRSGLGGELIDELRASRWYYLRWLQQNLSTSLMILAGVGFVGLLLRRDRGAVFTVLAFWVPVLLLTFVIGYRRPRFMFFAFPFFLVAAAYGAQWMGSWLLREKEGLSARIVTLAVAVLSVRIVMSGIFLVGDSVTIASGADTTLARHHPQWRAPATYVRERLKPDEVVLTTTYLTTLYYVGRVDNWYPTRVLWAEVDEAGMDDLKGLEELQAYVAQHPKGYFLSDWWRFERSPDMQEERRWVRENMTAHYEHSSGDITVWTWGDIKAP